MQKRIPHSKLTKVQKVVIIIVLSVGLSLLVELFGFNHFYWFHEKSNYQPKISAVKNAKIEKDKLILKDPMKEATVTVDLGSKDVSTLELLPSGESDPKASIRLSQKGQDVSTRALDNKRSTFFNVKNLRGKLTLTFSEVKRQRLRVKTYAANRLNFNWIRFIFMMISLLFVLGTLLFISSQNYALFAFFAILLFGSLSAVVLPPGSTFDEQQHVIKALSVADGNLDFDNGERVELPNQITNLYSYSGQGIKTYASYPEYQSFWSSLDNKQNSKLVNPQVASTAASYTFIQYLPEAVGLNVAKFLHLPSIAYIWLGRIANVLCYALLAFLAIRIVPQRKRLFTFFALQPVILYTASANGFDGILVGILLLAWSIIMKLRVKRQRLSPLTFAIITLLLALIIIFKVTYAPVLLMFFLLKKENFKNKKQFLGYASLISLILVVVSVATYYYSSVQGIDQWGVAGADPAKQMSLIFHHPISYIGTLAQFYADSTFHYAYDFFGSLGHLIPLNPFLVLLSWGIVIFLSLFDVEETGVAQVDERIYLTGFEKVVQIFQAICIGILSATALYITFTPVGSGTVEGFQARYMYPMIFPMFIVLSTCKIQNTFSKKAIHLGTLLLALGFLIYYVWSKILVPYCL
ncbi:DUF2142 domain-containing protein [Enterococcus sp. CSURQ0835]|uniref:DUF2142 domain-containing protein n=1 Tax=Enterococcus sp. CSURQ0835 TaxID=2681394 RepID=UPI00135B6FCF|nr:DUF2142 domain-containing protein [Enterococcus sp. CSURQ0835]